MQRLRAVAALALVGLVLVAAQIDSPSVPTTGGETAASATSNATAMGAVDEPSRVGIAPSITESDLLDLDAFTIAEIEETAEPSKPDNVDNDIIQGVSLISCSGLGESRLCYQQAVASEAFYLNFIRVSWLQLVDQFLNKGTLEQDTTKKINTEAQALVNTSSYWLNNDIEVNVGSF